MKKTTIGTELHKGLKEVLAHKRGKKALRGRMRFKDTKLVPHQGDMALVFDDEMLRFFGATTDMEFDGLLSVESGWGSLKSKRA